ncbi:hypothetical protein CBS101457_000872 [Exobasidium rhododendri]|nr:hypothetical protein CBS101457_000872 [Exobasidium rhododendri]
MGDSSFTLSDGLVVHTPLILLNKQIMLWDAPDLKPTPEKPIMPSGVGWEEWNEELWKVFEVVSPRPEIIVFGTGKTVLPPPLKLRAYLNKLGIQVDAHDSRNACQTYNLLVEEGRLVAAAMIPVDRKLTERVKATS